MLKEHYLTHNVGFGGILEKFNMAGISVKLKSVIEYIQWKRLESILPMQPEEVQSQLSPSIQQNLRNMK